MSSKYTVKPKSVQEGNLQSAITQINRQLNLLKKQFDSLNRRHTRWDMGVPKYHPLPIKTETMIVALAEEIAKLMQTRGILHAQLINRQCS